MAIRFAGGGCDRGLGFCRRFDLVEGSEFTVSVDKTVGIVSLEFW